MISCLIRMVSRADSMLRVLVWRLSFRFSCCDCKSDTCSYSLLNDSGRIDDLPLNLWGWLFSGILDLLQQFFELATVQVHLEVVSVHRPDALQDHHVRDEVLVDGQFVFEFVSDYFTREVYEVGEIVTTIGECLRPQLQVIDVCLHIYNTWCVFSFR